MSSQVPPEKNASFIYSISLVSQSDTDIFQTSVTLAAGDVQVSKDGGAFDNVGTLPTEIGTSGVLVGTLTSTEMNADRVVVRFHDAAGDEWQDALMVLNTTTQQIDELASSAEIAALNDLSAAEVNAEVDTALSDYDAPTKAELDSGLAAIPAAVWAYSTRTLSSISALLSTITADVWAYGTRTLTQSAVSVAAAVTGSNISVLRGDYWSFSLTGVGDISARTKLYFTVKQYVSQADSEALIQIEETDGLLYVNGAVAETASNGTIVVTDENAGDLTVVVKATETQNLEPRTYRYDVQYIDADGPRTPISTGNFTVTGDITRRVT